MRFTNDTSGSQCREKLCKQWDFPMSSGCLLHQRLIYTEAQQIQTPDIQLNVDNCLEEKWKMLSIVLKDSVTLCALDACTSHVWRSYLHQSWDRGKENTTTDPDVPHTTQSTQKLCILVPRSHRILTACNCWNIDCNAFVDGPGSCIFQQRQKLYEEETLIQTL